MDDRKPLVPTDSALKTLGQHVKSLLTPVAVGDGSTPGIVTVIVASAEDPRGQPHRYLREGKLSAEVRAMALLEMVDVQDAVTGIMAEAAGLSLMGESDVRRAQERARAREAELYSLLRLVDPTSDFADRLHARVRPEIEALRAILDYIPSAEPVETSMDDGLEALDRLIAAARSEPISTPDEGEDQ